MTEIAAAATKNKKRNRHDSENPENIVCGNMADGYLCN